MVIETYPKMDVNRPAAAAWSGHSTTSFASTALMSEARCHALRRYLI
jgi:hypothetical protein